MKTRVRTKLGVFVAIDPDDCLTLLGQTVTPERQAAAERGRAQDLITPLDAVAKGIVGWMRYKGCEVVEEWEERCSHCEQKWEADPDGCPCCCNKAVDEWTAAKAVPNA